MSEPLKVLIVEDEALLAMELESLVEEAGHQVVGWATSSAEAKAMVATTDADIAFVDIHLTDGPTGVEIAEHIRESQRSVVVFMTANPKRIPDHFAEYVISPAIRRARGKRIVRLRLFLPYFGMYQMCRIDIAHYRVLSSI